MTASCECTCQASSPPPAARRPAPVFQNENTHSPAPARGRRERAPPPAAGGSEVTASRGIFFLPQPHSRGENPQMTLRSRVLSQRKSHRPASRHTPGSDGTT